MSSHYSQEKTSLLAKKFEYPTTNSQKSLKGFDKVLLFKISGASPPWYKSLRHSQKRQISWMTDYSNRRKSNEKMSIDKKYFISGVSHATTNHAGAAAAAAKKTEFQKS